MKVTNSALPPQFLSCLNWYRQRWGKNKREEHDRCQCLSNKEGEERRGSKRKNKKRDDRMEENESRQKKTNKTKKNKKKMDKNILINLLKI